MAEAGRQDALLKSVLGGRRAPRWRWTDILSSSPRHANTDLIAALNDVASAVSTAVSVDEVLDTIVDRAKRITNTDKAALILTHDHSAELDAETLVVRGRRDQHAQEWWAAQLRAKAPAVFEEGTVALDLNGDNSAWLLVAPIRVRQRPVGLLAAINSRERRFNLEQMDFLAILGAFAASAIENARLAEQTRYVWLAGERDRIAREMHDGISQSLFSVALGLEVCRKLIVRDQRAAGERLEELQEMVDTSRAELRRVIYDLRSVKLQELGLLGAIEFWIGEVTRGDGVRGELRTTGEPRVLRPATESCLYRVAKESVSNVVKHANADHFVVTVDFEPAAVCVTVSDDGDGFDTGQQVSPALTTGVGLRSIEERVVHADGTLSVDSVKGEGTRIHVELPT